KIFRKDNESVTLLPFRAALHDIELDAAFDQQFDPAVIHLVTRHAEVAAAGEERGLGDGDGLLEERLEVFEVAGDPAHNPGNGGEGAGSSWAFGWTWSPISQRAPCDTYSANSVCNCAGCLSPPKSAQKSLKQTVRP